MAAATICAPEIFGEDSEGYGVVLHDGVVPANHAAQARLAAVNCPESAIEMTDEVNA